MRHLLQLAASAHHTMLRLWMILTVLLGGCAMPETREATIRVATFNMALNEDAPGAVIDRLRGEDAQARKLAWIIQTVRPDVILLNELDYDDAHLAADLFQQRYLETGAAPIAYPHRFVASVNTGVASGLDLNQDGEAAGAQDAWGFGQHPGQYGMLVLSRYPIDLARVRTLQQLRWSTMPGALQPVHPDGTPYYSDVIWPQLRLSSKSHWDLPIQTPQGEFHLLAAHPTPPVFDGPEDRNGRRNHDEIRLFADYIDPSRSGWIVDDQGKRGGLQAGARFVLVGYYNADPVRGASTQNAIGQFLEHPLIQRVDPRQSGAPEQTQTADFGPESGLMRVDYVLPSRNFSVHRRGVFWPGANSPRQAWLEASDHRLVWVDLGFR